MNLTLQKQNGLYKIMPLSGKFFEEFLRLVSKEDLEKIYKQFKDMNEYKIRYELIQYDQLSELHSLFYTENFTVLNNFFEFYDNNGQTTDRRERNVNAEKLLVDMYILWDDCNTCKDQIMDVLHNLTIFLIDEEITKKSIDDFENNLKQVNTILIERLCIFSLYAFEFGLHKMEGIRFTNKEIYSNSKGPIYQMFTKENKPRENVFLSSKMLHTKPNTII